MTIKARIIMERIVLFDDRGYLYFQEREDLVYIRDAVVGTVNEDFNLDFPDDTQLVLYSLDNDNRPYRWTSLNDAYESVNWLEEIETLFQDGDFFICDYNWNTADGEYVDALKKIIDAVKNCGRNIHFIMYSAVKYREAARYYGALLKDTFPENIKMATEVATFNEELEDMQYILSKKMKYYFKKRKTKK